MAYTHYWSRIPEFDMADFDKAAKDIRILFARAREMGIQIAGPMGKGLPELTENTIAFNGAADCGHRYRDLGKPFAAENATGVEEKEPPYDSEAAPYYSGPYLDTRVCGGSCAAGPFVLDRVYLVRDWERRQEDGFYDCDCETHFKPYDLIVTAALIRLKQHLAKGIKISSENPEGGFEDAKRLCRELFGWSSGFELERRTTELV